MRRLACVGLAGVAMTVAGAASANAAIYCVHLNADPCTGTDIDMGTGNNLQAALDAANATGVNDQISVRAGTYSGPFTYPAGVGGLIEVTGVGATTILTAPDADGTAVLDIGAMPMQVRNLHIDVPGTNTTMTNIGLDLNAVGLPGGLVEGVSVTIPPSPTGPMTAVIMANKGTFRNSSVAGPEPPSGTPIITGIAGSPSLIEDSTLHVGQAIHINGGASIRRVDAQGRVGFRVDATSSGGDANGVFLVEDSVWQTGPGATTGFGVFPGCGTTSDLQVTARNLTLVNNTAMGEPVASICNFAGRSANVDLVSSIALGGQFSLLAAGNNGPATINTSYSDYNPAMNSIIGAGTINEGPGNVNYVPGFVGAPDFHLAPGSQLVDIGDPAGLAAGESPVDLGGAPRITKGLASACAPRRDIGAFEAPGTLVPSSCTLAVALAPVAGPCDNLSGKARKRCLCKQKRSKSKRKKCLKRLKRGGARPRINA